MSGPKIDVATTTRLLVDEGVTDSHARSAAADLAEAWDDGDREYQTAKDILGDHLTNDDPRPHDLADAVAAGVGITLTDTPSPRRRR